MLSKLIKNTTWYNFSTQNTAKNIIHIGYGIDDNFARCTASSIVSFCVNNPDKDFIFHILIMKLSKQNMQRLELLAKELSITLILYEIDTTYILDKFPSSSIFTTAMYFRYILPLLLNNVDKVIYIDGDTLCINNADELFNIDITDYIIAAVPDSQWANDNRNKDLKLINHTYFLSGMLIINVNEYKKFHTFNKLIQFLSSNPNNLIFPDQDTLNVILTQKVKYIDFRFNYAKVENITNKNINDIIILHFATIPKPWQLSWYVYPKTTSINRYLYRNYEKFTPWNKEKYLPPKTYKEMEHYSKDLRKKGHYLLSIKWYLKYIINKFNTYCAS